MSIVEGHGARFVYESPVKQIVVEGSHAAGVVLEDGSTRNADIIIANADLPYVYDQLLPDRALAKRMMMSALLVLPSSRMTPEARLPSTTICLTGDW